MARGKDQIPNSRLNATAWRPIVLAGIVCALSCLAGCAETRKPAAEAPPPPAVAQADQPQQMPKLPEPQNNEVQQAMQRIFKESVLIDTNSKPSFVVGDFNGDFSQDIAIVVKPAPEKLADLNEEFPNWILRDLSGPGISVSPRLRVAANDPLLAVIHGYGSRGWRDPEATQTYLLKNAAGSGLTARSAKDFAAANKGRKLPQLRGDVIGQEIGGTPGYLYYSAATYSWYDPRTFKGDDAERGMIHAAHNEKVKK